MLKAPAQTATPSDTRARIIRAALATLKESGFSGATARAIARRGRFNQALIFYHFKTLNALLLSALDETSDQRMAAYRELLEKAESAQDLVAAAIQIYREDLDSGHITVLAEIIAGSLSHPELGPEIVARMEPWIDFAEKAVTKVAKGSVLAGLLPTRELAFGLVAFYLGIEMLNHLDGNRQHTEALFHVASQMSPMVVSMLRGDQ
jgi:AcrR family transcriptional regulator